jgi:hypothetical protein
LPSEPVTGFGGAVGVVTSGAATTAACSTPAWAAPAKPKAIARVAIRPQAGILSSLPAQRMVIGSILLGVLWS